MRLRPGYQGACSAVWHYIAAHTNAETGACCASQTKIAAALALCRETVCRAVKWLRTNGYLASEQRMVRQPDGTAINGTLRYRVFYTLAERIADTSQGLLERYRALLSRGQLRSTLPRHPAAFSRCDMGSATPPRKIYSDGRQAGRNAPNWEPAATAAGYGLSPQSQDALAGFYKRRAERRQQKP